MNSVSKCPVMHGAVTSNSGNGTSNRDWWPNQLNLNILHQHDKKSNPMGEEFDYSDFELAPTNWKPTKFNQYL